MRGAIDQSLAPAAALVAASVLRAVVMWGVVVVGLVVIAVGIRTHRRRSDDD